jgi:hypothetical protein
VDYHGEAGFVFDLIVEAMPPIFPRILRGYEFDGTETQGILHHPLGGDVEDQPRDDEGHSHEQESADVATHSEGFAEWWM